MRIAYITESFPELSETFILGKVAELTRRGHEVTVFTQFKPTPNVHPDLLSGLDLRKGVIRLPVWDRLRPKDVGRAIMASGIRPVRQAIILKRALSSPDMPGNKTLALIKALPFLRKRYDIIHAHYAYMGARYLEVSGLLQVPMVVSVLGHDMTYDRDKYLETYDSLFARVPRFFVSSNYLARLTEEAGCDPSKLSVLYPEVDSGFFKYVDRKSRGNTKTNILTVARLDWAKGLKYSLEAARIMAEENIDFEWRIVGEGKERDEIECAIKDLGLETKVDLVGARDREGCLEEMEKADLFVLSSVTESFGLAAAEAQATGLAVVATDVGGLPEVVGHEDTGFLVPSRNPEALADRIRHLIEHPEARHEMGKKGRERVMENFDKDMQIDRLIKHYQEVIEKWGKL